MRVVIIRVIGLGSGSLCLTHFESGRELVTFAVVSRCASLELFVYLFLDFLAAKTTILAKEIDEFLLVHECLAVEMLWVDFKCFGLFIPNCVSSRHVVVVGRHCGGLLKLASANNASANNASVNNKQI